MTDIRETIARAIHDADEVGNYPAEFSWEEDAEENRQDYRKLADAVLAVLPPLATGGYIEPGALSGIVEHPAPYVIRPVRCNLCGHKRVCVP